MLFFVFDPFLHIYTYSPAEPWRRLSGLSLGYLDGVYGKLALSRGGLGNALRFSDATGLSSIKSAWIRDSYEREMVGFDDIKGTNIWEHSLVMFYMLLG